MTIKRLTKDDIRNTVGVLNPIGHVILAFPDDAVTADFYGRQGVAFDPATHHVFGDLLHAQELSQHVFRAERCVAEIRYALGVSRNRKPHYTRLFHANVL